jgi:hypothetical protein
MSTFLASMENEELAVFHRRRGAEQEWARIEAETTDAEPPCIVPANACHVWGMGLYHWISCFGQISYVRLAFQDATSKECEGSEKARAREPIWSRRELADSCLGSLLAPKCQCLWACCKHLERRKTMS